MKRTEFTQEQIDEIINDYTKLHVSMRKIGEKFNVSKTVIKRVLTEANIEARKDNHRYFADYDKFKIIDSPEKAYWLGFIAADGCVYKRQDSNAGNFLVINIHQRDKNHLEKFKSFMNSNANIIDHIQKGGFSAIEGTPMCKITINGNSLVEDLIDKGVVPRKSLILEPPKIDKEYFLPFILGYFDGDGSISYSESEKIYHISIVGTQEILNWINENLNISTHLEKRNQDEKNNFYIRCGGTNKPYQIMKKLYDSSPVNLDRKYQKFLELEKVVLSRNAK